MTLPRVRIVAVVAVASVPLAFSACGTPAPPQCPAPPPPTTVTVMASSSTCPSATTSTSVGTVPSEIPPIEEGEATSTACADSLDECPSYGCATDAGKKAFNKLKRKRKDAKNKTITAQNAIGITVATLVDLQAKTTQGPAKNDFSPASRQALASITVGTLKLGEGVAVRLVGYMMDDPSKTKGVHANTGESVNCNLKGVDNNDFHIPMLANPGDNECTGGVAEMIPQGRLDAWSSTSLRETAHAQKKVMFVGRLFYDNAHNPNPQCANNGDPKRATIWEVHPVVEYYLCDSPNCTEKSMTGWTKVEDE